ncbi:MAG: hypothetical protein L0Y35_08125 [Flammeovirgaceae bacterium]|nr:hypothetical protein [Flammeovirgaceae bacterium]
MKNPLQKFSLAVFAAFLLAACGSDKDTNLSADQARQALTSAGESLSTDLGEFTSADGYAAFEDLGTYSGAGIPLPFGRTAKEKRDPRIMVKDGLRQLRHVITSPTQNAKVQGEEPFDFDANWGVYEWNPSLEDFELTDPNVTYIQIEYPTTGSSTNDAVLKLTDYEEVELTYEDFGGTYTTYEPTIMVASLTVDGTLIATIDLEASYNSDTADPVFVDVTFFVNPYTLDVDYDDRSTTNTSFSETLSKNGSVIISWGVSATFGNGKGVDEFGDTIEPTAIAGFVQLYNVRLDAAIAAPVNQNDPPSVSIAVTVNGSLAGNIGVEYVEVDGILVEVVYIYYTDGTKQPLDEIFGDLATELEGMFG